MENNMSLTDIENAMNELKKKKKELTGKEDFDLKKFMGEGFGLFDPIQWCKWLNGVFKTLLITAIIVGIVFGIGYWKGKKSKPIMVDMENFKAKVMCKYEPGKQHDISVKDYKMYFDDKPITEGDIPKLKPYGIELHPKLFAGYGTKGPAIGAGFELAHFYKLNLDAFAMSDKALYAGVSYDLSMDENKTTWFDNSSVGIAVGKGFESVDDTRIMAYWSMKF